MPNDHDPIKKVSCRKRACVWITAAVFFLNNTAYGQPVSSLPPRMLSRGDPPVITKISIPSEIGSIQTQYNASESKPFVIVIQDAHAVLDAQNNIRELIELLQKEYGVDLITFEGGKGKLDPTLLRTFPDGFIKKKVMNEYLERGELTGIEMAAFFNPHEAEYYGIEDWDLYRENFAAFLKASENKKEILSSLRHVKEALDREREQAYSPELNGFHQQVDAFEEEREPLSQLLKYLNSLNPDFKDQTSKYPHLTPLLRAIGEPGSSGKENLDVSIRKMAEAFQKKFSQKLNKKELMDFNENHQSLLTGRMDSGNFLKHLVQLAESKGLKANLSSGMRELLGQAETLSMIKGTKVFDELRELLRETESGMLRNPGEKEISRKYSQIRLLKDLASLELVREQFMDYQAEPETYLALLGSRMDLIRPALAFYETAQKRDHVFYKNLQGLIEEKKARSAIVLAGGFHASGIEANLKENGYSYSVITPKINSLAGHEAYFEVMEGNLSYKKYLETSFYDGFAKASSIRLMQEMDEQSFKKNIKLWRDEIIRKLSSEGRVAEAGNYTRYIDLLFKDYRDKYETRTASAGSADLTQQINKELKQFSDGESERLWKRFENQFKDFADGLRLLNSRSELNAGNIEKLIERTGGVKPEALGQAVPHMAVTANVEKSGEAFLKDWYLKNIIPQDGLPVESAIRPKTGPLQTPSSRSELRAQIPLEIETLSNLLYSPANQLRKRFGIAPLQFDESIQKANQMLVSAGIDSPVLIRLLIQEGFEEMKKDSAKVMQGLLPFNKALQIRLQAAIDRFHDAKKIVGTPSPSRGDIETILERVLTEPGSSKLDPRLGHEIREGLNVLDSAGVKNEMMKFYLLFREFNLQNGVPADAARIVQMKSVSLQQKFISFSEAYEDMYQEIQRGNKEVENAAKVLRDPSALFLDQQKELGILTQLMRQRNRLAQQAFEGLAPDIEKIITSPSATIIDYELAPLFFSALRQFALSGLHPQWKFGLGRLARIARNKNADMDIRGAAADALIEIHKQAEGEGNREMLELTSNWIAVLASTENVRDIQQQLNGLFQGQQSPEQIRASAGSFFSMIGDTSRPLAYMILKRYSTDKTLLQQTINQSGLSIQIRLYALGLLAEHHQEVTYPEAEFQSEVTKLIRKVGSLETNKTITAEIFSGLLSREEMKTYVLATLVWGRNNLNVSLMSTDAALMSGMQKAMRTTVLRSQHGANSDFEMGTSLMGKVTGRELLMILVHEWMHNVLDTDYNFHARGLDRASIHEFMADLLAFSLAKKMNWSVRDYMTTLRAKDNHDLAIGRGHLSDEEHEAARAQLWIIREFIDGGYAGAASYEQLFTQALEVIKNEAWTHENFFEFVQMTLVRFAVMDLDRDVTESPLTPQTPTSVSPGFVPILPRDAVKGYFMERSELRTEAPGGKEAVVQSLVQQMKAALTQAPAVRTPSRNELDLFLSLDGPAAEEAFAKAGKEIETFIGKLYDRADSRRSEVSAILEQALARIAEAAETLRSTGGTRAQLETLIDEALKQLREDLNFQGTLLEMPLLRDVVEGTVARASVLGLGTGVSSAELAQTGVKAAFDPTFGVLFAAYQKNPQALQAVLEEAFQEEGFKKWHLERFGTEAPGKLFSTEAHAPTVIASVIDLALFESAFKEQKTGQLRDLIKNQLQDNTRVAAAFPQRMRGDIIREIYEPGLDSLRYGDNDPVDLNRIANRMSNSYLEASLLFSADVPVVSTGFQGYGILTEAAVIDLSRLDPSSFVRLMGLVHQSEYLWKILEPDTQGREAFRVVTPGTLTVLAEFFNRLAQTNAIRKAVASAA